MMGQSLGGMHEPLDASFKREILPQQAALLRSGCRVKRARTAQRPRNIRAGENCGGCLTTNRQHGLPQAREIDRLLGPKWTLYLPRIGLSHNFPGGMSSPVQTRSSIVS